MANGRYAAQQVANGSPPQANRPRHSAMSSNERCLGRGNIMSPLGRILIWSGAYIGEEAELQMIVCVNKSGQQEITRQVKAISRKRVTLLIDPGAVADRMNVLAHDRDGSGCGCLRSNRAARSRKTKAFGCPLRVSHVPSRTRWLSQLQYIDCGQVRGGVI